MGNEVKLCWVLVDEEYHHVKEFALLKPNIRPAAFCPECRQAVILRLGKVREYHAAHKPGAVCSLVNPESALHLNAKLQIYQQLLIANNLRISTPCNGKSGSGCIYGTNVEVTFLSDWDGVEMEYCIDKFRPDIVLKKEGKIICALEVFVSHSVELEKATFLEELSIPWIEINATDIISQDGKPDWTIDKPLIYRRIFDNFANKVRCSRCQSDVDYIDREKKIENYHNRIHTVEYKIVDFYLKDNAKNHDVYLKDSTHYREIYFTRKEVIHGRDAAWILESHKRVLTRLNCSNRDDAKKDIVNYFNAIIKQKKEHGLVVDSPMNWQTENVEEVYNNRKTDTLTARFPKRFIWDYYKQGWILNEKFKDLKWDLYFMDRKKYYSLFK